MSRVFIVCLIAMCSPVVLAEDDGKQTVQYLERWSCYSITDYSQKKPLVAADRLKDEFSNGEFEFGVIKVAGVTYTTSFEVTGFDRRWNFGKYAFVIKPNGDGFYYDFSMSEEGESVSPSQLYDCVMK